MSTVKLALLFLLTAATTSAQSPSQPSLPKVPEPKYIGIAFSTTGGVGKISAADKEGKVQQWLEVWEDESKSPNVVTYVLASDGASFAATWGRGPINSRAFSCMVTEIPKFGEKTFWTATFTGGVMVFSEISDSGVKGLFENLGQARRELGRPSGLTLAKGSYASIVQGNIITFMKEKNRKKWMEKGWLRAATTCVNHF